MIDSKFCENVACGKLRNSQVERFAWRLREQLAKR